MIEGKKISKLDPIQNLQDGCCFPVLSRGATRRITFSALLNNIIARLPEANREEIDEIKTTISNLEKQLAKVAINHEEVEELLKDVTFTINGQNETILEYTNVVKEFERDISSSSIAESIRRINSFIPSTATETNKLTDKKYVDDSIANAPFTVVDELNDQSKQAVSSRAVAIALREMIIRQDYPPAGDLNDLKNAGVYYIGYRGYANFPAPVSEKTTGILIVEPAQNYISQIYIETNRIYTRLFKTTWSPWIKFCPIDDTTASANSVYSSQKINNDLLNIKQGSLWTTSGDKVSYFKIGRIVMLNSPDDITNLQYGASIVATLPSEYRPMEFIRHHVVNVGGKDLRVNITTDGKIQYENYWTQIIEPHNFAWSITYISQN